MRHILIKNTFYNTYYKVLYGTKTMLKNLVIKNLTVGHGAAGVNPFVCIILSIFYSMVCNMLSFILEYLSQSSSIFSMSWPSGQ